MTQKNRSVLRHATLGVLLAGIFPFVSLAASGTIKFTGEIVQGTCEVLVTDRAKEVEIGVYPTSTFKNVGDVSASRGFTIGLRNCEPERLGTIRFDALTPTGQPGLLAVSVASGVGIEILNNEDKPFPVNQDLPGAATYTLDADGAADVYLKARYKSFANLVGPGEANATATFVAEYR